MALAFGWFLDKFVQTTGPKGQKVLTLHMNAYNASIVTADGGDWDDVEVYQGYAIVKVKAEQTTINTLISDTAFTYIGSSLTNLVSLSDATILGLKAVATGLPSNGGFGFTANEWNTALGNSNALVRTHTNREVLDFLATMNRQTPVLVAGVIQYIGLSVAVGDIGALDARIV